MKLECFLTAFFQARCCHLLERKVVKSKFNNHVSDYKSVFW